MCGEIKRWNLVDGNFRQYLKNESNSLMPTLMALQLLQQCPQRDFGDLVSELSEKMASKVVEVSYKANAIISSKDSFKLTTFFLTNLINRDLGSSNKKEQRDLVAGLFKYVFDTNSIVSSLDDVIIYSQLLGAIEKWNIVGFKVKKNWATEGSNVSMSLDVIDCFGDIINKDSKGNTHLQTLKALVSKINDDGTQTKLGETTEKLDLSYSNSQVGIFHTVVKPKGENYSFYTETPFIVTTNTEITNVKFGIDSNKNMNYYGTVGHKGAEDKADQGDYIKIRFALKNSKIRPQYTIARLFHPEHETATASVPAVFDESSGSYYATFDLGDPDVILPYSSKYIGKIFVADYVLEKSLLYTFGTFDISYGQSASGTPLTDRSKSSEKEFEPNDPEDEPFSPFVNNIFCLGVLTVTLVWLGYVSRSGFGIHQLTKFRKSGNYELFLFNIMFLGLFGLHMALILYFWMHERFMEVLFPLCILTG